VSRHQRELVTPEGVPIHLKLADAGERIAALFFDLLFIFVPVIVLQLLAERGLDMGENDEGSWQAAFLILVAFLLQNFYFVFFELRWQGQTPGKRIMKTRVVDSRGGPLTSEAVVTRNLVRQVELFLPAAVAIAPTRIWPDAPGWAAAVGAIWALIALFLPLFNRERARIGDLVAGTRVVAAPRTALLPDLAERNVERRPAGAAPEAPAYAFTDDQLDIYGAYELQVLDGVLRAASNVGGAHDVSTVHASIRKKIGWQPVPGTPPIDERRWLEEFYIALRARLERKLLFGKRKADKYAR
jgi:uncharacterized RDD family membrane protein YckC